MIIPAATVVLLALVAGSLVYCVLVVAAARRYTAVRPKPASRRPPISVLKPLHGLDDEIERNLRSFFAQRYPDFELLFAVRDDSDPALGVVETLSREFPRVAARTLITGEPPYPNAKVFSLDRMIKEARHDLVVMSDSDVRVGTDFLDVIAAELDDESVGLVTCPYRAVPGGTFWSTLEALTINTEFLGGVLTARMLDGMKFALGPTIAARRRVLTGIGGFDRLADYLAEDFVMGKFASEAGWRVILSSSVIEHHIGGLRFAANARHRLRWCRSTRRSRPAGYAGQVFTIPLPPALLLWLLAPAWWPIVAATLLFRAAAAWATAGLVLTDPLTSRRWWLIPLADLASFFFWLAGFFGNTITWRGRTYRLLPDGRFELAQAPESK